MHRYGRNALRGEQQGIAQHRKIPGGLIIGEHGDGSLARRAGNDEHDEQRLERTVQKSAVHKGEFDNAQDDVRRNRRNVGRNCELQAVFQD